MRAQQSLLSSTDYGVVNDGRAMGPALSVMTGAWLQAATPGMGTMPGTKSNRLVSTHPPVSPPARQPVD